VLLQECTIGEAAVVGALSMVPERMQVPPRTLVAGVPAQIRKELSEAAVRHLAWSAGHYVELGRAYQREGIGNGE